MVAVREVDAEAVRSLVTGQLEAWVESLPEAERSNPVGDPKHPGFGLTPDEILLHVRDGSDEGRRILGSAQKAWISG